MLYLIQSDPIVPAGILTGQLAGPYRLVRLFAGDLLPSPGNISALIVLGGTMGAYDDQAFPFLPGVRELIRNVLDRRIPFLGICLGGQLLAAASGGRVVSRRWEELGCHAVELTNPGSVDPLFAGLPPRLPTFQWHHDSFDLPPGAVLLAASRACPHQAFRLGANAWGLQFHPEVTVEIVRDWSEAAADPPAVTDSLTAAFRAGHGERTHYATRLLANFLAVAATHPPS